jgi:molybdopterin-binding protein
MSIITKIEGWFTKQEKSVEKVFSRIEPLIVKAEPIVMELSAVVGVVQGIDKSVVLTKVCGYLSTVTTDTAKVEAFLKANQGAPVNSILHNAAVFALTFAVGPKASAVVSDMDLAVQTAYSVIKALKATTKK